MIYTITLNPALDRILTVETILYDNPNRVTKEETYAGGKGIDVSKVLTKLNVENKALGFAGGFIGLELEGCLLNLGVNCEFIRISGETRTNIIINDLGKKKQISFNSHGPMIKSFELMEMINAIKGLKDANYVTISGSTPLGVSPIIYRKIVEIAKDKGATVLLDADDEPLKSGIMGKPHIVKPNVHELERLVGRELKNLESITEAAVEVQKRGIEIVLVSMGPNGMVLVAKDERLWAYPPKVKVENTIGAGDSAVAGFLHGVILGENKKEALMRAVATGTAATLIRDVSITDDYIKKLLVQTKVNKI